MVNNSQSSFRKTIPKVTGYSKKVRDKSIYLFLGEDYVSKERKTDLLRKELFRNSVKDFNFDIIYADTANSQALKEVLYQLPVNAKQRLVLIKDIDKFSHACKETILSYLSNSSPSVLLVLDTQKDLEKKDEFIDEVARHSFVLNFRKKRPFNTFDLARALMQKRGQLALNILVQLLASGIKSTWILGGLTNVWLRQGGSREIKERGLEEILQTDINIKTGRLKAQIALETLIVRLSNYL